MFRKYLTVSLCLLLVAGCEQRRDTKSVAAAQDDAEYVIAVLVDLSGSFFDKMTEGGQAHDFMVQLLDKYFRDRIGTNDQIILAQISGTPDRSLLWQGTPMELRKEFPNSRAFCDFLRSKADPRGSEVHNALAQTVEQVMSQPNVLNRKAKSAVFAMTDMFDTGRQSLVTRRRAVKVLSEYGKLGGVVHLYFVDQTLIPVWQRELATTGLEFSVVSEIRRPKLPSFE